MSSRTDDEAVGNELAHAATEAIRGGLCGCTCTGRQCTRAQLRGSSFCYFCTVENVVEGCNCDCEGCVVVQEEATSTDSDATEHAVEIQGRGFPLLHLQPQVMLQSAPPPTYEVELLQIWARSRPVARISMATVCARRECRAVRATWALHCMALLGQHNLASCRGCGHYPTYRTCVRCHMKWCDACHTWSQLCWKCYRPRHALNDCGEFLPGRRGPGGNGRFE